MNKAFEKILERLEEEQENEDFHDFQMNEGFEIGIDAAKEIVQEVAEEYNNGWIPCSERLPEVPKGFFKVKVLIVDKGLYEHDMPFPYVIAEYCPEDYYEESALTGKKELICKKGWQNDYYLGIPVIPEPIAWQPLPEPYKGA